MIFFCLNVLGMVSHDLAKEDTIILFDSSMLFGSRIRDISLDYNLSQKWLTLFVSKLVLNPSKDK